jgi:hypothetical protein
MASSANAALVLGARARAVANAKEKRALVAIRFVYFIEGLLCLGSRSGLTGN